MKISAKEIAKLTRVLSRTFDKPHFTSAIIVAAGCGSRMNSADGKTKQMTELDGIPIIVRTLGAFSQSELINEIIVVAREDEKELYRPLAEKYNIEKISAVVTGGDSRQESVLKGFEAISDKSDFVAIHDGARCLVTDEMIEKVLLEAYSRGAATAAHRPVETIKIGDFKDIVTASPDRDKVWLADTPQVFKTELYRAAAYVAKSEDFTATDDNSLAEHIGFGVKLVDCGKENIKITTPIDLVIAEAILEHRKKKFEQE